MPTGCVRPQLCWGAAAGLAVGAMRMGHLYILHSLVPLEKEMMRGIWDTGADGSPYPTLRGLPCCFHKGPQDRLGLHGHGSFMGHCPPMLLPGPPEGWLLACGCDCCPVSLVVKDWGDLCR